MKKFTITLAALLLASFVFAGCNTTKGAGKDLQVGGEKLQNSAENHGAR
jgi:predicted small secreted protein